MSVALKVEGLRPIPGWRFENDRAASFQYLDEPHDYILNGNRLWSWSAIGRQVGWINTDHATEENRYRGSWVHKARHLLDSGSWTIDQCDPKFRPYLDGYLEFKHIWKFIPRLSEKPLYHPSLLYGVTPDAEALILGGEPSIVEFKTGQMQWWTAHQTAAQDLAVTAWDGPTIHRLRVGVELKPNGKFRAKEFTDHDNYERFLSALMACQVFPEPGRLPPNIFTDDE